MHHICIICDVMLEYARAELVSCSFRFVFNLIILTQSSQTLWTPQESLLLIFKKENLLTKIRLYLKHGTRVYGIQNTENTKDPCFRHLTFFYGTENNLYGTGATEHGTESTE
jgi:hypothetical protein